MKQRLTYFDNAKGFLILLVVFGHLVDLVCHSSSGPLLHYTFLTIWSFHMPAFLFIAGLFDHKRDAFPLKRV
ncbi:MAG: acyltransferase, partial [Lachnospiraceae bacterium]|nr:acyltransferase [Lachnospiraceae bacterium]